MATCSRILAWKIPWTENWWATVHGVTRVGNDLVTKPPPEEREGKGTFVGLAWEHELCGRGWRRGWSLDGIKVKLRHSHLDFTLKGNGEPLKV